MPNNLNYLAEISINGYGRFVCFRLSGEGMVRRDLDLDCQAEIAEALAPDNDEEIIVTFSKQRKPK